MKNPLNNFTIAVTGDFGPSRGHDKMKQWVLLHGGTFVTEMTSRVTHLVCSKDHFKKKVSIVKQAQKLKSVHIVSFDWLENTLLKKSARKEGPYLLGPKIKAAAEHRVKRKYVRKQNIRKGMEQFEKECKDFETDMFSNGYHVYRDSTTFPYAITLARPNLLTNQNKRYHLKLYQSHAVPKLFACYTKYSDPDEKREGRGKKNGAEVLAPVGSSFETAFEVFKKFFELKTRRRWDERLGEENVMVMDAEGEEGEVFAYAPPRDGEPRGMVADA